MSLVKAFAFAALFTACGATALASPVIQNFDVALPNGVSATHTVKGEFEDIFHFTGLDGLALVSGSLSTSGKEKFDIDFSSITLKGQGQQEIELHFDRIESNGESGYTEKATLDNTLLSGPFTLTVKGFAGEGFKGNAELAASYEGTFNFIVSADAQAAGTVPEPAGLALVGLAGVAALIVTRRRRQH